jgi:DNA-binding MarR family transcriptional regulator
MTIEEAILQNQFQNLYQKAWINVVYTGNRLNHQTERILRPYGISLPQYNILRILRGAKGQPLSLMEIKRRLLDPNPDLSRLIDRMSKQKKWVHRCEDPGNRRRVQITITEAGLRLLESIDRDEQFSCIHQPQKPLDAAELEQLNNLLDRFRCALGVHPESE